MKLKSAYLFLFGLGIALFAGQSGSGPTLSPGASVPRPEMTLTNVSGATPLYFIANEGQMNAKALYYARTPGYTLWLTREGLVFDRGEKAAMSEAPRSFSRMTFIGANEDLEVVAADPTDYKVSYFYGRDEADWKTGIATSKAVLYENLYDGIDLKVYGTAKQVEYDWVVAPGAQPERIRFTYSGPDQARLNVDGDLVMETPAGQILQRKPVSHQVIEGRKVAVASAFRALPDGSFGFSLGAYDPRHALTIDPLAIVASTFLGGARYEIPTQIAMDPTGAVYVCGLTESADFPPEAGTGIRRDAFVSKLSPDGKSHIYTVFFPLKYFPQGFWLGMAVDKKGFVHLCGATASPQFPLKKAFQTTIKSQFDGFVLKLSKDGRSLLYSSYIGGGGMDVATSLGLDEAGAAYIAGYTSSRDFPRKRPYQSEFRGAYDAFVAKVAPDGSSLEYATYLGGAGYDRAYDLAVDARGSVVVSGDTGGRKFPVKSAFQKGFGGLYDGFVAKLEPAGNALVFSSYFGGTAFDAAYRLALDGSGAVYLTGFTAGIIPLKNAFQSTRKGFEDGFVAKVEPNGRSLAYSSYLGGGGSDQGFDIAVDSDGAAHVVGGTKGKGFPLKSPYQAVLSGSTDGFLTIVEAGGKLQLSTYLGGRYQDHCDCIALGAEGQILIGGVTNSPDFPGIGQGFQNTLAGDMDVFIVKFSRDNNGGYDRTGPEASGTQVRPIKGV